MRKKLHLDEVFFCFWPLAFDFWQLVEIDVVFLSIKAACSQWPIASSQTNQQIEDSTKLIQQISLLLQQIIEP